MRRFPPGPAIMGIVNVTPDSFSDGGEWLDPGAAVAHALRLVDDGATLLDLGAESTRPGARPVPPEEELARLRPVLERLRQELEHLRQELEPLRSRTPIAVSVDTRNAGTARAAVALGADAINDVSGLRHDPAVAAVAAESGATLVLMHSRGTPATMRDFARYDDVVAEVIAELQESVAIARAAGCRDEQIVLDPGLGFAKTPEQSLELLRGLPGILDLGFPVLVGASRKAVVGHVLARDGIARPISERLDGSVGFALGALASGASWVRVHDVKATADALAGFVAASGGSAAHRGGRLKTWIG